jgi:hypothetical protein
VGDVASKNPPKVIYELEPVVDNRLATVPDDRFVPGNETEGTHTLCVNCNHPRYLHDTNTGKCDELALTAWRARPTDARP